MRINNNLCVVSKLVWWQALFSSTKANLSWEVKTSQLAKTNQIYISNYSQSYWLKAIRKQQWAENLIAIIRIKFKWVYKPRNTIYGTNFHLKVSFFIWNVRHARFKCLFRFIRFSFYISFVFLLFCSLVAFHFYHYTVTRANCI